MGCRPEIKLKGKPGRILLDQVRCVDKVRLGARLGGIPIDAWHPVLLEMLA
jgi:mRNA interferase MazF